MGFPIRISTGQRLFAPHRSFSQRTTSFIACVRQGIHQMPLSHLIALIINTYLLLLQQYYSLSTTLHKQTLNQQGKKHGRDRVHGASAAHAEHLPKANCVSYNRCISNDIFYSQSFPSAEETDWRKDQIFPKIKSWKKDLLN